LARSKILVQVRIVGGIEIVRQQKDIGGVKLRGSDKNASEKEGVEYF
jgi:hypothetical protein